MKQLPNYFDDSKITTRTRITDAYARGQVRLFKQKLAAHYASFNAMYESEQLHELAGDLARCSRKGKARALAQIQRLAGPGLQLESTHANGRLLVFSLLVPREAVAAEKPDMPAKLRGQLLQNCVTLNYFVIGIRPDATTRDAVAITEGLWTLEVTDHVLGRIVERSGGQHLETAIRDAHRNLLRLSTETISQFRARDTCVKAGPGCFIVRLTCGVDTSLGRDEYITHIRATTYFSDNEMKEQHLLLTAEGAPGDQLGDSLLLPHPMREATKDNNGLLIVPWLDRTKKEKAP